jgi:hypothetical protein
VHSQVTQNSHKQCLLIVVDFSYLCGNQIGDPDECFKDFVVDINFALILLEVSFEVSPDQARVLLRPDIQCALRGAVVEIGAQLILTSLVIVASMMVLTFGSFPPGVHFGIITMTIVLVALLADLLILPRLLCARWGQ